MKRVLILSLLLTSAAAAESKPDWPVRKLTFTITDKAGWTPTVAKVPVGSEVQLTLENKSNAPACFEIAGKTRGTFVKKPVCIDTGESHEVTFFANVDKGTYPIRNRYEQQAAGRFTVE
jgi:hypothetical protein